MRFPFGKKGLVATGAAIAGSVAFWRVRSRRRDEEALEWEAEIAGAVDEGRSAAATSEPATEPSGV